MWRYVVQQSVEMDKEALYEKLLERDKGKMILNLQCQMRDANDFDSWHQAAVLLDVLEGRELWKVKDESPYYDYSLVQKTVEMLKEARKMNDTVSLMYHLRNSLHKNFGGVENVQLYEHTHAGTKYLIEDYVKEVILSLEHLVNCNKHGLTVHQKLVFFKEARRLFGRSALLLSGGATFGLYHLGVIKALTVARILPRVISGSSAGSLVASIVGVKTDPELLTLLEEGSFHFDYFGQGENIFAKIKRLIKEGAFLDVNNIKTCFQDFFGDITFEEAYQRTGRILNITVSHAARLKNGTRLLNHLTAPKVVIWSAACASCAVPGLFRPVHVLAKAPNGELIPFEATAQHYLDGSYLSDLPIEQLSELFSVSFSVVSQVNPYVIPFVKGLQKQSVDPPPQSTARWIYKKMSDFMKSEIHHRCVQAVELGIAPRFLEYLAPIISQPYCGDITIIPDLRNGIRDYINVISNPDDAIVKDAILCGMRSTWPALSVIANHNSIERTIFEAVELLRSECQKQVSRLHDQSIIHHHPEFRALANLHMLQLTKPFDTAQDPADAIGMIVSITVAAPDRPGLLADIAMTLTKIGLHVKSVKMTASGSFALCNLKVCIDRIPARHQVAYLNALKSIFENLLCDQHARVDITVCPNEGSVFEPMFPELDGVLPQETLLDHTRPPKLVRINVGSGESEMETEDLPPESSQSINAMI